MLMKKSLNYEIQRLKVSGTSNLLSYFISLDLLNPEPPFVM